MRCQACGLRCSRDLCNFCTRTVALVKEDRCVACRGPVDRRDDVHVWGLCHDCRVRHVRVSSATRSLLKLTAVARYQATT
jgi:hypothetical protein